MSIYGDFLSNFSSENKRWKADLKNKTLICEDKKYIESSMYDIRHDLIVIDGINSDTSRKKCNEICFEIIENLYHKYKYSIPSERSEKYRQREYFRALKPDEMTDEQLVCASLAGYLTWDEEQMGSHWFYQGKDKDLIILKKWIKC